MTFERDDAAAAAILGWEFGVVICPPFSGFVQRHEGRPVLAVLLNCFTGNDVHLTVAGKRPVSVGACREIHRMCFDGLRVSRVTAITREGNLSARKSLSRIGFQQEGVLRSHFGAEDGILYGLTKADIKLMRP